MLILNLQIQILLNSQTLVASFNRNRLSKASTTHEPLTVFENKNKMLYTGFFFLRHLLTRVLIINTSIFYKALNTT